MDVHIQRRLEREHRQGHDIDVKPGGSFRELASRALDLMTLASDCASSPWVKAVTSDSANDPPERAPRRTSVLGRLSKKGLLHVAVTRAEADTPQGEAIRRRVATFQEAMVPRRRVVNVIYARRLPLAGASATTSDPVLRTVVASRVALNHLYSRPGSKGQNWECSARIESGRRERQPPRSDRSISLEG
jgi:hypothetical protein